MMIGLRTVRYCLGITVMAAHFLAIGLFLTIGYRAFGNDLSKSFQGVAVIAPVTAVYVTAFLTYVVKFPQPAPDEIGITLELKSFSVQYGFIVIFCAAVIFVPLYMFLDNEIPSDYATIAAGAVDSLLGVYVALIFKHLFPT